MHDELTQARSYLTRAWGTEVVSPGPTAWYYIDLSVSVDTLKTCHNFSQSRGYPRADPQHSVTTPAAPQSWKSAKKHECKYTWVVIFAEVWKATKKEPWKKRKACAVENRADCRMGPDHGSFMTTSLVPALPLQLLPETAEYSEKNIHEGLSFASALGQFIQSTWTSFLIGLQPD